jgi:hypothetical protein
VRRSHRRISLSAVAVGLLTGLAWWLGVLDGGQPGQQGGAPSFGRDTGRESWGAPAASLEAGGGRRAAGGPRLQGVGLRRAETARLVARAREPKRPGAFEATSALLVRRAEPTGPSTIASTTPSTIAGTTARTSGPAASLYLLDVIERPGDPVVAVAGLDGRAPRDLVLWQVDEGRESAAPLGRVRSTSDGVFGIDRLLLSSRGVRLVVAEAGADPFGVEASEPVDFAPRRLHPSPTWLEAREGHGSELVVAPNVRAQVLVVGDDEGRELARIEVSARAATMTAAATVRHSLGDLAQLPSRIANETPEGGRSAWRPLPHHAPSFTEERR